MIAHGPSRIAKRWLALVTALASCACTTRDAESVRRADTTDVERELVASQEGTAPATTADVAPSSGVASVEYYPAARLNQVAESLSRGSTTGHTLGARGTYQFIQVRRVASGTPEIHDRWIDITMVQAGRGTLLSGGRVSGGTTEAGGEHRGGTITGGTRRPVAVGDLMIIQAGVPHQYEIARGDSLRYLTVKVLAAPR